MKIILSLLLVFYVLTLKSQTWHQLLVENSISPAYVNCTFVDNVGNTWLGTTNGVYKIENGSVIEYNNSNGLTGNAVYAIIQDNQGKIWVGTQNGLNCINNGVITTYNGQLGMQNQNIRYLALGNNNDIWIGTFSNGIIKFNGNSFIQYTTNQGLIGNYIKDLAFDGTNLWIATGVGLSKFDGNSFNNYSVINGLPSNIINSICLNLSNQLIIATNNGISIFNGSNFTNINTSSGLPSDSINLVECDMQGNYWIVTSNLIAKYNGTTYITFHYNNIFPSIIVKSIYCKQSDVYFGTDIDCIKTRIWSTNNLKQVELSTQKIGANIQNIGQLLSTNSDFSMPYGMEFPLNSSNFTVFNSNIWLAGLDPQGNIHGSLNTFNTPELVSGPYFGSNNPTDTYDSLYNRIWYVTQEMIDSHVVNYNNSNYIMPEGIKYWPQTMAEFEDLNLNTIYEPQLGEYPKIRGDKCVLKFLNDNRVPHSTGSTKIKADVALMYWVYSQSPDEALQHTVFCNMIVTSYHHETLSNVYLGIQSDIDIGDNYDDFAGSDPAISCYYGFNGAAIDDNYGDKIPCQGVVFLSSPLHSFLYFNNESNYPYNDPSTPIEYYNILRGYWKDGASYTIGGNGYGGSTPTFFMFDGDPLNTATWTEVSEQHTPGDRRQVGSIGPLTLIPGKSVCIDFAYVLGIDTSALGNHLTSVNVMKDHIRDVISFYNSSTFYCDTLNLDIPLQIMVVVEDVETCENLVVQTVIQVTGAHSPYTFQWQPTSGVSNPTQANPLITVSTTTDYVVTVTDSNGNTDTDTLTITINPPQPLIESNYTLCFGENIVLQNEYTYIWSHIPSIGYWANFFDTGDYWVIPINSENCTGDTIHFHVDVLNSPDIELGPTQTLCNNESTDLVLGVYNSYLWNDGSTGSSIHVDASLLQIGNYLYSVTVTNSLGCSASDLVVIKVVTCVDVPDAEITDLFSISPNPFYEKISIVVNELEFFDYELYDLVGNVLQKKTELLNSYEINTAALPAGLYHLKIKMGSNTKTFKLIKM